MDSTSLRRVVSSSVPYVIAMLLLIHGSLASESDNSGNVKLTPDQVNSLIQQLNNQNKQPSTTGAPAGLNLENLLNGQQQPGKSSSRDATNQSQTSNSRSSTSGSGNSLLDNLLKFNSAPNGQSSSGRSSSSNDKDKDKDKSAEKSSSKEQQIIKQLMSMSQQQQQQQQGSNQSTSNNDDKSRSSSPNTESKELNVTQLQQLLQQSANSTTTTTTTNNNNNGSRASLPTGADGNNNTSSVGESKSGLFDFITNPIHDIAKGVLDLGDNKKQYAKEKEDKEKAKSPIEKIPFGDMLKPLLMTLVGKKIGADKNGGAGGEDDRRGDSSIGLQNKQEYRVTIENVDKKNE